MNLKYTAQCFTADISVTDYIARFRDEPRFIELCKQCPNYGNSWGCPPFDFDTDAFLRQYQTAHLMATKITPDAHDLPIDVSSTLILPERRRIEAELLDMEHRYGGRAFAYVGSCLHCGGADCRRKCGLTCLHPDKVRPSLEAFGFDIGRTLSELFGIELLWGSNGCMPDYLVIVSAFLHNNSLLT